MTGREKIIVVMAGVAVVIGGGMVIRDHIASGVRDSDAVSATSAEVFRRVSEERLRAARMTTAERMVLDAARSPWRADIVRDDGTDYTHVEEVGQEQRIRGMYQFSGYATVGDTRFAVINNRAYRIHEELDDHVAVLQEITPEYVALRVLRDGRIEQIPFEGSEHERK